MNGDFSSSHLPDRHLKEPRQAIPVSAKAGVLVHLAYPHPNGAADAELLTLCGQIVVQRLAGTLKQHPKNRCAFCFNRVGPNGYPHGWLGESFLNRR